MMPSAARFLLLLPCLLVLALWGAGLGGILAQAGMAGRAELVALTTGTTGIILLRTHLMALGVALVSLLIGYPVAAQMVRAPRRMGLLLALLLAPLLTSVVVRTFGWMVLLGPHGAINAALVALGLVATPVKLLFNATGVFLGLTEILFPFAVLSIYPARRRLEGAPLEAAASLGAGPLRSFLFVVLPLTASGLLSAFSIVYLLAVGAIVTPLMLGGPGSETFGAMTYQTLFRYFDIPRGALEAVALTLSCGVVLLPLRWLERRLTRSMPGAAA
jgi:putative spermidine/putrescine transport system permease protein